MLASDRVADKPRGLQMPTVIQTPLEVVKPPAL
jgi:hypothetical protein